MKTFPILLILVSLALPLAFLAPGCGGTGGTLIACPNDGGCGGASPNPSTVATTGTGPFWSPCDAPLPFGSPSCNPDTFCDATRICGSFEFCDARPELGQCADPHGCPHGTCYLQGHVGDPCLADNWCQQDCGLGCDTNATYTCVVVDPAKHAACPP